MPTSAISIQNKYTYLGGDIIVTGKMQGLKWSPSPVTIYQHSYFNTEPGLENGYRVDLQVGTYPLAAMLATGILNNDISAIQVSPGYKITIYDGEALETTLPFREYTSNVNYLVAEGFDNFTSSIKVEKLTFGFDQSTCPNPNPAAPQPGTISNYGTMAYTDVVIPAGVKINNYNTWSTQNTRLVSNVEFNNFSQALATRFFEINSNSEFKPKSASTLVVGENLYMNSGKITGEAQNYASVTTRRLLAINSNLISGLLKLCAEEKIALVGNFAIAQTVTEDCSFQIPGSSVRTKQLIGAKVGLKSYELSNHLGNVLTTVSDRRIGVSLAGNPTLTAYYSAVVLQSSDYYAFGSSMTGRGYKGDDSYRYGFNGKEKDKEGMGGGGSTYDYGFRIYNPSLGKFLSKDPLFKSYPWNSTYAYSENCPIRFIDLDGLEKKDPDKLFDVSYYLSAPKFEYSDNPLMAPVTFVDNVAISIWNGAVALADVITNPYTATVNTYETGKQIVQYHKTTPASQQLADAKRDLTNMATDVGTYEDLTAAIVTAKVPLGKTNTSAIKPINSSIVKNSVSPSKVSPVLKPAIGLEANAIKVATSNISRVDHAARHLIESGIIKANAGSTAARTAFQQIADDILANPIKTFDHTFKDGVQAKGFYGKVDGKDVYIFLSKVDKGKLKKGDIVTSYTPSANQVANKTTGN